MFGPKLALEINYNIFSHFSDVNLECRLDSYEE